jgi:hypothetical protein
MDSSLPNHIVAGTKRAVRLLRRELDSGDFRDRRSRRGDKAEQAEQKHHHGPIISIQKKVAALLGLPLATPDNDDAS